MLERRAGNANRRIPFFANSDSLGSGGSSWANRFRTIFGFEWCAAPRRGDRVARSRPNSRWRLRRLFECRPALRPPARLIRPSRDGLRARASGTVSFSMHSAAQDQCENPPASQEAWWRKSVRGSRVIFCEKNSSQLYLICSLYLPHKNTLRLFTLFPWQHRPYGMPSLQQQFAACILQPLSKSVRPNRTLAPSLMKNRPVNQQVLWAHNVAVGYEQLCRFVSDVPIAAVGSFLNDSRFMSLLASGLTQDSSAFCSAADASKRGRRRSSAPGRHADELSWQVSGWRMQVFIILA
jgi:hypothetical protein